MRSVRICASLYCGRCMVSRYKMPRSVICGRRFQSVFSWDKIDALLMNKVERQFLARATRRVLHLRIWQATRADRFSGRT